MCDAYPLETTWVQERDLHCLGEQPSLSSCPQLHSAAEGWAGGRDRALTLS